MTSAEKRCKDCIAEGITTKRKLATKRDGTLEPGPRCVTHHRARKLSTRASAWARDLMAKYGITPEQYWTIYRHQGGKCALCRRATGARKRLSVDHDHKTGLVRGLLCTFCNKHILGHLRDEAEAFLRGYDYLTCHPALMAGVRVVVPDMRGEVDGAA